MLDGLSFATFAASIALTLYHQELNRLGESLQRERHLRQTEREGRINLQKAKRQSKIQENDAQGYRFKPIGFIESPFRDRRGTPRQPILVSAGRGRIRMNVHRDFFNELQEFSHIWVLFIFHENTNEDASASAKVIPPRLGRRVGCLSTRSPHRPNPIGLSVCQVLGVTDNSIEISCIDFVDGTPVLDVKPYIPYDIIPSTLQLPMMALAHKHIGSLRVPSWIHESDIALREVKLTGRALESLGVICTEGHLKHCAQVDDAVLLIRQVLAQDIRGIHQGRGSTNIEVAFECRLDCLRIEFTTNDDVVLVQAVELTK